MPSFSRTPASRTEPAVGASTWASGSQVCNGTSGTLTAKPANNATKTQPCTARQKTGSFTVSALTRVTNSGIEKVSVPVCRATVSTIPRMPTSVMSDPVRV